MADTDSTFAVTERRSRWFAVACTACAVWVIAYFAATRLVSPGGTSGTVLGDLVYPQTEALATLMLLWAGTRASGSTRRFCFYMAASTFMGLCGDVTWAVLVLVVHSPPAASRSGPSDLGVLPKLPRVAIGGDEKPRDCGGVGPLGAGDSHESPSVVSGPEGERADDPQAHSRRAKRLLGDDGRGDRMPSCSASSDEAQAA